LKTHLQQAAIHNPRIPFAAGKAGPMTMISAFPPAAWTSRYDAGTTPAAHSHGRCFDYGDDLTQVIRDLRQMEREIRFPFVPVEVRVTTPLAESKTTAADGRVGARQPVGDGYRAQTCTS